MKKIITLSLAELNKKLIESNKESKKSHKLHELNNVDINELLISIRAVVDFKLANREINDEDKDAVCNSIHFLSFLDFEQSTENSDTEDSKAAEKQSEPDCKGHFYRCDVSSLQFYERMRSTVHSIAPDVNVSHNLQNSTIQFEFEVIDNHYHPSHRLFTHLKTIENMLSPLRPTPRPPRHQRAQTLQITNSTVVRTPVRAPQTTTAASTSSRWRLGFSFGASSDRVPEVKKTEKTGQMPSLPL